MTALTTIEQTTLASCEAVIEKGLTSFFDVGTAILTISDQRLYRETHSTFKDYIEEKWNMSVRRAYQLCESVEVIKEIQKANPECAQIAQTVPASHAIALSKAPKGTRAQVLQAVASTGPVTAAKIEAAIVPVTLESEMKEQFKGLEIPPVEPKVSEFYCTLEAFTHDALERATDKQLISMSVFAVTIPKLIKSELQRRSK